MVDMKEIPESTGIKVIQNVTDLETGKELNTVICLVFGESSSANSILNDEKRDYCACAMGTPGGGKTKHPPYS
jgi:hypothetical protein